MSSRINRQVDAIRAEILDNIATTVREAHTVSVDEVGFDIKGWLEEYWRIAPQDPGQYASIPFILREEQHELVDKVIDYERREDPCLIACMKGRQFGISTVTEGYFGAKCLLFPGRKAFVVAQDQDQAEYLLGMSRFAYENLPPSQQKPIQYNDVSRVVFAQPHYSTILAGTSNRKFLASGKSSHYVHWSELAKCQDPGSAFVSLMQTIPLKPGTVIIIEFTAEAGGQFAFDLWKEALAGQNRFEPVFFSWTNHKPYQVPLSPQEKLRLSPYWIEYQEKHQLTEAQMKWAIDVWENKCRRDYDLFNQEYPATMEDAWISAGRPFFDKRVLSLQLETAMKNDPQMVGEIQWSIQELT